MKGKQNNSPNAIPGRSKRDKRSQKKAPHFINRRTSRGKIDILERVNEGFVAFDADLNYIYVNKSGGELLGRKPQDLIGKNYWKEYPEAKGTLFANAYVDALKNQKAIVLEEYYEPFDRWYENRIHPSADGLSIFFTEITDRKRAEFLLADEKNILQMIAQGVALPQVLEEITLKIEAQTRGMLCTILLLDPDGIHVRHGAAPSMEETFIRAIDGQPIGPKAGSCGTAAYRKEAVFVSDIETDPLWTDYREVALAHALRACWSTPILSSEGVVLGTFAMYYREPRFPKPSDLHLIEIATRLTAIALERKRTDDALKESQTRLRSIIDNEPECVKILDLDGNLLDMNPAGLAMIEAESIEHVRGLPVSKLVRDEHRMAFQNLASEIGRGRRGTLVFEIEGLKGTRRWLETHAAPMSDENGTVKALLGITRDITERKQAEEIIRSNTRFLQTIGENFPNSYVSVVNRDLTVGFTTGQEFRNRDLDPESFVGQHINYIFGNYGGEILSTIIEKYEKTFEGQQQSFELLLGDEYQAYDAVPLPDDDGNINQILVVAQNITERKRTEQDLSLRLQELTAIHRAAQELEKLLPPDQLAQKIIRVLEEMLKFEYAAVLLVDEASGELFPFALSDQGRGKAFLEADKQYVRSKGIRLGVGITGWVAQNGQSVLLGDVRTDERYRSVREDIRSEICVPIFKDEQVIGVINIETTRPDAYSQSDQQVLETMAAHISVSIQNSQLIRELRDTSLRLGEVEEAQRRAISRELHDRVGQNLTALSINLQNIKGLVGADSASALAPKFHDTQELVQDTTRFIREVMADLHPPELEDYGLGPALETYAERAAVRGDLRLTMDLADLQPPLPPEKSIALFRAAQEALNNVLKHANAKRIEIRLEDGNDRVRLRILDDGRGFEPSRLLRNGTRNWGLRIMKQRIEAFGGRFNIRSEPGRGTEVTFEIRR